MRPHNEIFTQCVETLDDIMDAERRINRITSSRKGSMSSMFTSESYIRMKCRMVRFVQDNRQCGEPLIYTHTQDGLSIIMEMDQGDCAVTARWSGGCTYPSQGNDPCTPGVDALHRTDGTCTALAPPQMHIV